jgi:flagellar biosynthetic protein FlhB
MADDQTEKATPRRRQRAREQGQVVRSRELTGSLVLLTGTLLLGWFSTGFILQWREALFSLLEAARTSDLSLNAGNQAYWLMRSLLYRTMGPVMLFMGVMVCVSLLVNVAQTGGIAVRENAFQLDISRLSPTGYFKQVFSTQGLARMLKTLIPSLLLVWLAISFVSSEFVSTPAFSLMRIPMMFSDAHAILLRAGMILLVWSGIDYGVEWWTHEKMLRMSKQDIRDEMKDSQGSPQVRRRIRQIQRQLRRRKLKADVSRASVVVTNPTHFAVALEFSMETMQAPKVVAKGRNLIAEQIKQEARSAMIPIVENPPLARSLYRSVEVGDNIPQDLYAVVAEILAFLYRAELERTAREKARNARPATASRRGAPAQAPPPTRRPARPEVPIIIEEAAVPGTAPAATQPEADLRQERE